MNRAALLTRLRITCLMRVRSQYTWGRSSGTAICRASCFFSRSGMYCRHAAVYDLFQVNSFPVKHQAVCLDPREVQNVVDHVGEVLTVAVYDLRSSRILGDSTTS